MNYNIDISNVELKTKRLKLRPFRLTDLDDFYEYCKVDGVGDMAGWTPHKNKEESLEILKHFIENKNVFAIEKDGKVIGSIGIEKYPEDIYTNLKDLKAREIGFVLSKDYWNQGIMTEAAKEVLKYLFEKVKLDVVTCGHFNFNKQSKRVQEKLGFKHFKEDIRKAVCGKVYDSQYNIMTKEDYLSIKK